MLTVALAAALAGAVTVPASAAVSTAPSFSWVPNGTVYAMAEANGVVYIGGTFTSLKSPTSATRVTRNHLAALSASTGVPLAWNPSANDTVRALAVGPNGTIYAGGDFTSVGGSAAIRVAAITSGGSPVGGFKASANSTVRSISATSAGLFIGGNFGAVNGKARVGAAKLDPSSGATLTGWNAGVGGGRVRALSLSPDGVLLLGGSFTSLSGRSHLFLGAVSPSTGAATSWTPSPICSNCQVLGIDSAPGRVYTATGGSGGGRAVAWSLSSNNRLWQQHADGDVQAVAVSGSTAYFGGHFGPSFAGATRHQLAALSTSNGAVLPYALSLKGSDHPGIWAIVVDGSYLRLGGGLQFANAPEAKYAAMRIT